MPPNVPQDILDQLKTMQAAISALQGRVGIRPAQNQIVGGSVTVGAGGTLEVVDNDGSPLLFVGGVSPTHPDGSPQRGLLVYREDGSLAFSIYTTDANPQGLAIHDAHGNTIFAEDVITGGLARPWLDIPMYPARQTNFLQTTSAAYETLWRGEVSCINPTLTVSGWSWTPPGSAGNLQVLANSATVGSPVAVPTGGVTQWTIGPALHGASIGSTLTVEIQAQLTSGPGPVYVGVHHVRGEQT